ncbi:hypothetical protein [Kitasatospora viridis]|uniref:Uncharacterized protein n=1 Tax=Kitasatospora viridis TaxID=281105 RepID=A0A561S9X9_9ACTN|nr:hypothetical protein [Kitasatospora viridis]TWF71688.1 hypothetical protein FHX73_1859 [Kitasatospora viridis]
MAFSPPQHTYSIEYQRAGYRALGKLFSRAAKADMEPINWTISHGGVLIGEVHAVYGMDAKRDIGKELALYTRWLMHLAGDVEHDDKDYTYALLDEGNVDKAAYISNSPGLGGASVRLTMRPVPKKELLAAGGTINTKPEQGEATP